MFNDMLNNILETLENNEQEDWFIERTNRHIKLVQKAIDKIAGDNPEFYHDFDCNELIELGKVHDASKFREPERTPYISITWRHKLENENGEFDPIYGKGYKTPGTLDKEEENQATLLHITYNQHHPEFWLNDKSLANINADDRDKSDKVIDASAMSGLAIAEMIADWVAMAEELKKNTAREWFEKQRNVRWKFTEKQEELIDKLLKVFEK